MRKYISYLVFQFYIIICLPTLANDDKPTNILPNVLKGGVVINQNINEKTLYALEKSIDKVFSNIYQIGTSATIELNKEAQKAKTLFKSLEDNSKIITSFSPASLQSLPVALPMPGTSNVFIAINKATYYPTHTELEVYAKMLIGDNEFYFGNRKVQYVPNIGFAGNASLALLGSQNFTSNNYGFSFTGGTIDTTPLSTISQLKINCGVFDGLLLKGKFELNTNQFVALDANGYEINDKIEADIDFQTKDLSSLNIKIINLPAFGLKNSSSKIGFIVTEAEIDLSEKKAISASEGFLNSNVLTNTDVSAVKQWTGFYASELSIFIPVHYISTVPSDIRNKVKKSRPKVNAKDLIIDASGLYFSYNKTNPILKSKLMGIGFQLSLLDIVIKKSNFNQFDTKGLLDNPFSLSSLNAATPTTPSSNGKGPSDDFFSETNLNEETIAINKEELEISGSMSGSDEPSFKLTPKEKNFVFFGGSTEPDQNSQIEMVNQDNMITPKIGLYGKLNIGTSQIAGGFTVNSGTTGSDFSGLTLRYENVVLKWQDGVKFSFDRISLDAAGSLLDLPIGITSIDATYDKDKKEMAIRLDSYIGLNKLTPTLPRIEGVVTFNWNYGYADDGNIIASFKSWSFDRLIIRGQIGPIKVGGVLTLDINKDEAEFNSKLLIRGSVEVSSEFKFLQEFKANFVFGNSINNYTFFYVDALLYWEKGVNLGTTGLQWNGLGFGFYYNMRKIPKIQSNYSLTGCKYGPSAGYWGAMIMAGVTDVPTKGKYFQGYAGIDIGFGPGMGLADIGIFVGARFGSENSLVSKDGISKNMIRKKAVEKQIIDADGDKKKYDSIKTEYDNAKNPDEKQAVLTKNNLKNIDALTQKQKKADFALEKAKKIEQSNAIKKLEAEMQANAKQKLDAIQAAEKTANEARQMVALKTAELEKARAELESKTPNKSQLEATNKGAKKQLEDAKSILKDLDVAISARKSLDKAEAENQTYTKLIEQNKKDQKIINSYKYTLFPKPPREYFVAQENLKNNFIKIVNYSSTIKPRINKEISDARALLDKELSNRKISEREFNNLVKQEEATIASSEKKIGDSDNELANLKKLEDDINQREKDKLRSETEAEKANEVFTKINNTDAIKNEITKSIDDGIKSATKQLAGEKIIGKDKKEYDLSSACAVAASSACKAAVSQMNDFDKVRLGVNIFKLEGLQEQQTKFKDLTTAQEIQGSLDKINNLNKQENAKNNVLFTVRTPTFISKFLSFTEAKYVNYFYEGNKKGLQDKFVSTTNEINTLKKNISFNTYIKNNLIDGLNLILPANNKVVNDVSLNEKLPSIINDKNKYSENQRNAASILLKAIGSLASNEAKLSTLQKDAKIVSAEDEIKDVVKSFYNFFTPVKYNSLSLQEIKENISILEITNTAAKMRLSPKYGEATYDISSKQALLENTASKEITFNGKSIKGSDIENTLKSNGVALKEFKTTGELSMELMNLSKTIGKTPQEIERDKAKMLAYEYRDMLDNLNQSKKILDKENTKLDFDKYVELVKKTDINLLRANSAEIEGLIKGFELNQRVYPTIFTPDFVKGRLAPFKEKLAELKPKIDEYDQAVAAIAKIKQENGTEVSKLEQELGDFENKLKNIGESDRLKYSKEQEELEVRLQRLKEITYDTEEVEEDLAVKNNETKNVKDAETEDFDDINTQGSFVMIKGSASYNVESKEFHLLAMGYANIENTTLTIRGTRNTAGLLGNVDLCIGGRDGFHLWAGTPGQPFGAKITYKASMGLIGGAEKDIQFYLLGGPVPTDPKLITRSYPEGIQTVLDELIREKQISFDPRTDLKNAYSNAKNGGIGFGFAHENSTAKESQIGPIVYNIGFGIGVDFLLASDVICLGYGTVPYYGTGTLVGYAKGRVGFRVSFWGANIDIPLISAQLSLVLSGGLPEPMYFKGNADFKYSVLAGAVRGRIGVDFSLGTPCEAISLFDGGRLNVVNNIWAGAGEKQITVEGKYAFFRKFSVTLDGVKYDDSGLSLDPSFFGRGVSSITYNQRDNNIAIGLGPILIPNTDYLFRCTAYISKVNYYTEGKITYCNAVPINPQKYNQPITAKMSTDSNVWCTPIVGQSFYYCCC